MRRAGLPLLIALLLAGLWLGSLKPSGEAPAPPGVAGEVRDDAGGRGSGALGDTAGADALPGAASPGPADTGDGGGPASPRRRAGPDPVRADTWLPAEAVETLALIEAGGPFPYRRDGVTFENRERLLPPKPRGYYREYTVPTPGARDRGARRIVAGGDPPEVFYYTADHYRSFRRVEGLP
jgi:guanyl-specific ribonuclease Sa